MTPPTKELEAATTNPQTGWVAAFTLLSWLGVFLHDRADLPHQYAGGILG